MSGKVPLQYRSVLIVPSFLCLGRHVSAMPHSQERQWLLLRHRHLPARRPPLVPARLPEQVELERPPGRLPVPIEQAAPRLHGAQLHAVRRRGPHGDPHVRLRRGRAVRRLRQDSPGAVVQPRQGADDHRRRRDDVADRLQGHDGVRARPGLVRAAPVQGVPLLRHGVLRLVVDPSRGVPGPRGQLLEGELSARLEDGDRGVRQGRSPLPAQQDEAAVLEQHSAGARPECGTGRRHGREADRWVFL